MSNATTAPPPEGYKDISVPLPEVLTRMTIWSLVLLALPIVAFIVIYGSSAFWDGLFRDYNLLVAILILIVAIIGHEGIHALGWKIFGELRWDQLRFGIDRKTLSPYCHALAPMKVQAYRIGAVLPGLVTGVLPTVIGLVQANAGLTAFGALMLSAAIGDFLVLWVIREVPADALVLDHPSNAGCYVKVAN